MTLRQKPSPWTLANLAAAGVFSLCVSGASVAQVAVVASPRSSLAAMSPEQVANLYLGKTPGTAADLPEGNPVRDQFYSKATGKTASQVKAVWARLTFSGKATAPKEFASTADVKKFVAGNLDAVGYIEKSAVDSTVKVLLELN